MLHLTYLDLPLPSYLASVLRNTSRAERVACALSLVVLVICISLIVYFTGHASQPNADDDIAPHTWNITRNMWLAEEYNESDTVEEYAPLRLVIINHSASPECHTFRICAAELRNLQGYFIHRIGYDIPYNFIVGNDGRMYEGRGWGIEGAHTLSFNNCSLGIGFIGDYRSSSNTHSVPTEAQIQRTHMLLAYGVQHGYLHPDYVIVGYRDLRSGDSPGSNLYNIMKQWEHYDNKRYFGMNCNEIREHEYERSRNMTI